MARVDLAFNKMPIEQAVAALAGAAKRPILLGSSGEGAQLVTAHFRDTPVDEALRALAKIQKLCIVEQENCILLVSRQEYLNNYAESEIVQLRHCDPDAVLKVVLGSQSDGKNDVILAKGDPRTRTIVFRGDPGQIAAVTAACLQLDSAMTSEVFKIRYASVVTVAKEINQALRNGTVAPTGKDAPVSVSVGSLVSDERSNRLIVHDTPENIALCREIIETLDIPVDSRVFSTGSIDAKTIADQIKKGELGGTEKGDKASRPAVSADATVQVIDGTNQIIVTDTPERLNLLEKIMMELNGNIVTVVIQPHNSQLTQIAEVIKGAYPGVAVAADPRSSSLIISGHKERVAQVESLVKKLDSEESTQVVIEAKLMLVSCESLRDIGVRFFGQDLDGLNETLANISTNGNFLADSVRARGSVIGSPATELVKDRIKSSGNFLEVLEPNIQINAVVRALENDSGTKILSNPSARMMTGQMASFFSGTEEPYKEITLQDDRSVESVKFAKVGVDFKVTPYISPSRTMMLDVVTEFSTLRTVRDGIPVIDRRTLTSVVQASDNETILLGGLISEESGNQEAGIPGLRSLRGIGALFGQTRGRSTQQELIIVITPHIVVRSKGGTLDTCQTGFPRIQEEFGAPPVFGAIEMDPEAGGAPLELEPVVMQSPVAVHEPAPPQRISVQEPDAPEESAAPQSLDPPSPVSVEAPTKPRKWFWRK